MTSANFGSCVALLRAGWLVRAVNFHNTPARSAEQLHRHLSELARDYVPIGLRDLDLIFATGQWPHARPPVLLVFYEGYANNAAVAAPVLDDLGLTGWFFLPTLFLDCPPAQQRAFAAAHSIDLVDEEATAERLAMTWDEAAKLATRHVLAAHTGTHESVGKIVTSEDLDREIFGPFRAIARITGSPAPATAFLGGSPLGVSAVVDEAVREAGYRYLFSNTRIQTTGKPAAADRAR